jgi:hypothetical protein
MTACPQRAIHIKPPGSRPKGLNDLFDQDGLVFEQRHGALGSKAGSDDVPAAGRARPGRQGTKSPSVSCRSFRITFTRSRDNSPCTATF